MKKILVVDDDRELAALLAFGLRLRTYAVELAANGAEALALLARPGEPSFDAIILDWNMPVMGGEEFLKRHQLRSASCPPTPIIVITARPDAEQKARQRGAVAVVTKPFNIHELLRV